MRPGLKPYLVERDFTVRDRRTNDSLFATANSHPQRADACDCQRGRFRNHDICRRIGSAQEDFFSAVIQFGHADVEQQNVVVVQIENIDARSDGVVGKACALTVDRKISGGLWIQVRQQCSACIDLLDSRLLQARDIAAHGIRISLDGGGIQNHVQSRQGIRELRV